MYLCNCNSKVLLLYANSKCALQTKITLVYLKVAWKSPLSAISPPIVTLLLLSFIQCDNAQTDELICPESN